MRFVFTCRIEAKDRMVLSDVLNHIADSVSDPGNYWGGYDWCTADYSWEINDKPESTEVIDDDEEEE